MGSKALEVERIRVSNRDGTEEAQYLWRFKAGNGQTVSWSGDTYHNLSDCLNGAKLGSPVTDINQESGVITYAELTDGDTVVTESEGAYRYIDKFEDQHGRPVRDMPDEDMMVGKILKSSPFAQALMSRGLRLEGDHIIMDNDSVYHRKNPETNTCTQCNLPMGGA